MWSTYTLLSKLIFNDCCSQATMSYLPNKEVASVFYSDQFHSKKFSFLFVGIPWLFRDRRELTLLLRCAVTVISQGSRAGLFLRSNNICDKYITVCLKFTPNCLHGSSTPTPVAISHTLMLFINTLLCPNTDGHGEGSRWTIEFQWFLIRRARFLILMLQFLVSFIWPKGCLRLRTTRVQIHITKRWTMTRTFHTTPKYHFLRAVLYTT